MIKKIALKPYFTKIMAVALLFGLAVGNAQEGHIADRPGSAYMNKLRGPLIQETDLVVRGGGDYKASGDFILYDGLKQADIQMNTENLITLSSVNYNVLKDEFYYKDLEGNFFTLPIQNGIKRIIIGKDIFENVSKDAVFKIMQVLYKDDAIGFYKNYFIENEHNNAPRTVFNATKKESYKIGYSYYIQRNYITQEIRLIKKDVLNLFHSKDEKKAAKAYMKDNDLSFRNEDDVKKLFIEFF